MDPVQTLLAQGGLGLLAGTFMWLYLNERKESKEARKRIDELQEARRLDAVEARTDVTGVMSGLSQNLALFTEKIETARGRRK